MSKELIVRGARENNLKNINLTVPRDKLVVFTGLSGSGKTSLAYAMGQFIENESVIVPIQPMWKERSDMIGYFKEFTKKFNETTLLRKMYEAGYRKEMYVTVLDEMNIVK